MGLDDCDWKDDWEADPSWEQIRFVQLDQGNNQDVVSSSGVNSEKIIKEKKHDNKYHRLWNEKIETCCSGKSR